MTATKHIAARADSTRAEAQLCGLCADDGQCMSRSKLCQVMRTQAPVDATERDKDSHHFERKRPDDTEGGEL